MQIRWKAAVLIPLLASLSSGAGAEWLESLFPPGITGYDVAPGVTVVSRLRPELNPGGIRAGSETFYPALEEGIGYDDNVLSAPSPVGSWVTSIHPSLLLKTVSVRDSLTAFAEIEDRRDLDAVAQSRIDGRAMLSGSTLVGNDQIGIAFEYLHSHEDRSDIDALPTDHPVPFRVATVRASYAWISGAWTLTPGLDISSWQFGDATIDGRPSNESYRDRLVFQGSATLAYEMAPQRSILLIARTIAQDYTHTLPAQVSPASTGYQFLAGLEYAEDSVWRYRFLFGGEYREFATTAYAGHGGLIAEAELAWMPTGLSTVTAALVRRIEDAAQEGIAEFTYNRATLRLDHELRRNLLLNGVITLQRADFAGGVQQSSWSAGAGITWLMNRRVSLLATYDFVAQRGTGNPSLQLPGNFKRDTALLTMRLGW
jgi:hypothetical protein